MVIDWNVWHPDFSPGKTSSLRGTQAQEINFAKTAQNLLKYFQVYPTIFGLVMQQKSCDFGGSRFSSESAEQNVRFIRDPNETNHLINLLLPVSPAPSRTEWWVKWLPTLRLHLEKASLSPFVCYFCVFVCREHAYPPKEDDSLFLSYLMRDEGGIASKWICWEAEYLSMKHFVCGAAGL